MDRVPQEIQRPTILIEVDTEDMGADTAFWIGVRNSLSARDARSGHHSILLVWSVMSEG